MLLSIHAPSWLVSFWEIYGGQITPVLVTLLLAIVTAIAINIKSTAKSNAKKTELQIEYMKKISEREDATPQLEALTKEISELKAEIANLKQSNGLQSDMFNLAFQNSSLREDVKDNLESLTNKIKYGTSDNRLKDLENTNSKLREEIDTLKQKAVQKIEEIVEPVVTRTRR